MIHVLVKLRTRRALRALIYFNSLQVAAKAAMLDEHLDQMKGDESMSPLGPLPNTWDDAVGPPTFLCHVPSALPFFTDLPGSSDSLSWTLVVTHFYNHAFVVYLGSLGRHEI